MCSIDECFAKVYFGNELIFGCMSNVLHFYYIIANGAFTNPVPSRTFIQKIIKFQKHLKIIVNMFYSLLSNNVIHIEIQVFIRYQSLKVQVFVYTTVANASQ